MSQYINNKDFLALIVAYKEKCALHEQQGKPIPVIPNEIGECFIMIATKLSNKGNFVGYTYKDEMVGDGIENCLTAIHSFNPEKSQNPFAYFTQVIWWAFLRRIEKEKKQTYVKYKALENIMLDDELSGVIGEHTNIDLDNDKMTAIIETFEAKKAAKKASRKSKIEELAETDKP